MRWFIRFLAVAVLALFVAGLFARQRGGFKTLRDSVSQRASTSAAADAGSADSRAPAPQNSGNDDEIIEPVSLEEYLRTDQTGEAARLLGLDDANSPVTASEVIASSDPVGSVSDQQRAPANRAPSTDRLQSLAKALNGDARPSATHRRPASARSPQLLIVVVENLSREDLGAYGQTLVRTPFLDGLAANGLRLTQFAGSTSGHAIERTALWYGDIPSGKRSGAQEIVRLAKPSLPESLARAGYAPLLLGDCSWTRIGETSAAASRADESRADESRASESRAREWENWFGWTDSTDGKFAPYPKGIPHATGWLDIPSNREADTVRFDRVLTDGADHMFEQCDESSPLALVATVSLRWWGESCDIDSQYAAEDWTEQERRHASAVTGFDTWVSELYGRFEAARGRRGLSVVVIGLPRAKKAKGLTRFRDAVPSLDEGLPSHASWPYAPLIACSTGAIPSGRVVNAFCGFQDLLPTLLEMTGSTQRSRSGLGASQWRVWLGDERD